MFVYVLLKVPIRTTKVTMMYVNIDVIMLDLTHRSSHRIFTLANGARLLLPRPMTAR